MGAGPGGPTAPTLRRFARCRYYSLANGSLVQDLKSGAKTNAKHVAWALDGRGAPAPVGWMVDAASPPPPPPLGSVGPVLGEACQPALPPGLTDAALGNTLALSALPLAAGVKGTHSEPHARGGGGGGAHTPALPGGLPGLPLRSSSYLALHLTPSFYIFRVCLVVAVL